MENYSGLSHVPPEMGEFRYISCTRTFLKKYLGSDVIPNGTDTEEQLTRREEPPSKPPGNYFV